MKKNVIQTRFFKLVKKSWLLFLILMPTIIWYIIFKYVPMGGASLAFKTFRYDCGVLGSPWCGFENFKLMFHEKVFWQAFKNTLIFGFGKIVFQFPIPIIIAILINEIKNEKSKKFFQTVFTFSHFISWVVLASIFSIIFSSNGALNQFIVQMGGEPWLPMLNPDTFRPFVWISNS